MPTMTMRVENTSEAEWMASETMALEWARIPAASLKAVRTKLPMMVLRETRMAKLP